jgi:nickel-responsive transcriptional regulator NikR
LFRWQAVTDKNSRSDIVDARVEAEGGGRFAAEQRAEDGVAGGATDDLAPLTLLESFHDHHDIALAAMDVHLDHEACMEVAVLSRKTQDVQHLADHVVAERGVRHGRLVMVPVELEHQKHAHGTEPSHRHMHIHVGKTGSPTE